jgi:hypothetical protein
VGKFDSYVAIDSWNGCEGPEKFAETHFERLKNPFTIWVK